MPAIDPVARLWSRHSPQEYKDAPNLLRRAIVPINPPNEWDRIEPPRQLHQKAINVDPGFADGYAGMSQVHSRKVLFEHTDDPASILEKAIAFAHEAIDPDNGPSMAI